MTLIAYFLFIMVSWQDWPYIAGPYTLSECYDVLEYLVRRGYEVSSCEVMPVPQEDAVKLEVPYIPTEKRP